VRVAALGLAVVGQVLLVDIVREAMDLSYLVEKQGGLLVALRGVRAGDTLDGIDVEVDLVRQKSRRELRRVERRAGE
jgi:hypothetical protein